jgi:putative heme-binding domain-containing protein
MLRGVYKLVALCLAVGAALAQEPHSEANPYANDPAAVSAGGDLYRLMCTPCHLGGGQTGRAPNLAAGNFSAGNRDEDLYRVIFNGQRTMPAYGPSLGQDNIWKLVAYIRSISAPAAEKPTGNAAAGLDLFWTKGKCGQCHRIGPKGGAMGPDLTSIGKSRSLEELRKSITDPDAQLARGFATITVVTRDGKKIQGTQRGYDFFSAQLIDAQGNYHSFLKSEVKELTRAEKSLMPSFSKTFSAGELNDLVAYLYAQGR